MALCVCGRATKGSRQPANSQRKLPLKSLKYKFLVYLLICLFVCLFVFLLIFAVWFTVIQLRFLLLQLFVVVVAVAAGVCCCCCHLPS